MKLNTVIFDMDGLLIDSEPLWKEAADHLLKKYGKLLSPQQYARTTGLRTKEFLGYWFAQFNLPQTDLAESEKQIVSTVMSLIKQKGRPLPGVDYILQFFLDRKFRIGLASSSAPELIDVVIDLLGIRQHLDAYTSADALSYGKPHPEVYLNCANELGAEPNQCICFEDSFNGLIAAKAAKMNCVIVSSGHDSKNPVWEAADLKISTLTNFNELLLSGLDNK